jgi:hypothetical protein
MQVLEELLDGLRRVCASFPDRRQWRPDNMAIADARLAAFSLLQSMLRTPDLAR